MPSIVAQSGLHSGFISKKAVCEAESDGKHKSNCRWGFFSFISKKQFVKLNLTDSTNSNCIYVYVLLPKQKKRKKKTRYRHKRINLLQIDLGKSDVPFEFLVKLQMYIQLKLTKLAWAMILKIIQPFLCVKLK